MKELKLILEHLRYQRTRSLLLLVTIVLAFATFGILGALRYSLNSGDASVTDRRLIVAHEAGLMQTLPLSYLERIRKLPGVQTVSHATWQGIYYREARDMIMSFAVDPATWLDTHPDMVVTPEARAAFLRERRGMLVSEALAAKYGWKVGDAVPFSSIIYQAPAGEPAWTFIIAGLFRTSDDGGGRNYAVGHYGYLNENRSLWRDSVGTFVVTPRADVPVAQLAQRIDAMFATDTAPTSTTTDRAFHAEFFAQFGDVVSMIQIVIGVTFASLVLVVSSALALSTRQRSRDIGVLRVLGYSNGRVYRLVVGQAALLMAGGAAVGLALAFIFNWRVTAALPQFLPDLGLPLPVLLLAAAIALLLAFVTAAIPTAIALRVKPVEAFAMEQA
jgi:putative ABC transport system permease protein